MPAGRLCAIASCKNYQQTLKKRGSNIIFHYFPRVTDLVSANIRREWVLHCKRTDKFNPDNSTVCSEHFTENDYERDLRNELLNLPLRKILKKTAVPTVNLGEESVRQLVEEIPQKKTTPKEKNSDRVNEITASASFVSNLDDQSLLLMSRQDTNIGKSAYETSSSDSQSDTGEPSSDPDNPDYVPNIHMGSGNAKRKRRFHVYKLISEFNEEKVSDCCCVSSCANKLQEQQQQPTYYKFPKSIFLENLWKSSLNLFRRISVINLLVCEHHFDQRDFIPGTKILKKMAIPSIQRNDERHRQILVSETNCEKSQNPSLPISPKHVVDIFHSYSKPGVKYVEPSAVNELEVEQNNENNYRDTDSSSNQCSIDSLENTIVINDNSARIVITSKNSSLREKLVKEVQRVLEENTSMNVPNVLDDEDMLDFNVPPDKPLEDEAKFSEEVEGTSDTMMQVEKDVNSGVTWPVVYLAAHRSKHLVASRKKFNNLLAIFGNKCPYCEYKDTAYSIELHIRKIHYRLFPDTDTGEGFYEEVIKEMEKQQEEEEDFPVNYLNTNYRIYCQYCAEMFNNLTSLIIHVKKVHETIMGPGPLNEAQLMSGMRNCTYCNRVLNNSEEYMSHVKQCIANPSSKSKDQSGLCEFCGKIGTRQQIILHKAMAHDDKYFCEICGHSLHNSFTYKQHMLRHENKKKFKCSKEGCGKGFNTPNSLRTHIIGVHCSPEKWKFVCNECDRRFPTSSNLRAHQDTHSTSRLDCQYCDKNFKGPTSLRHHISRIHLGLKRIRSYVVDAGSMVSSTQVKKRVTKRKEKRIQVAGETEKFQDAGVSYFKRMERSTISESEESDVSGEQVVEAEIECHLSDGKMSEHSLN